MNKPLILVTGAAGRTGSTAALTLLQLGYPVRAMVRRMDHRVTVLKKAGAEIFIGDQLSFSDMQKAMLGTQRAYHCPPFAPNLLENLMTFAVAAEEAKLEVVALMSMWNTSATHPSINSRSHWLANQIYRLMPNIDVIHINPGLFGFVYLLALPVIANLGVFVAPFGDGLNAPPANEDIGRVAAYALANPQEHIGKSYRPTGPKLLAPQDIAEIYSHILRRKVVYKNVPFKMFAKAAKAQGFPLFEIAQMRYYSEELKNGAFAVGGPTNHVEQVTGAKAESFATTAERYIRNPELVHPSLSIGNKWSTMAFMLKMMLTPAPNVQQWELSRNHPLLKKPELAHQNKSWQNLAQKQQLNLLPMPQKQSPHHLC